MNLKVQFQRTHVWYLGVKTCFIDLSSNDNGINLNHSFIRGSVAIYGGRVLVRHSGALVKQKTPPRIKWTTVWTHLSPFKSKLCSVSSYFRCDAVLSIIVAKWETEKKKMHHFPTSHFPCAPLFQNSPRLLSKKNHQFFCCFEHILEELYHIVSDFR